MDRNEKFEISRRDFLKATGAAAAVATAGVGLLADSGNKANAAEEKKSVAASEKIVVGVIGVAGRGFGHLNTFKNMPDVEIGAVCDVYDNHLNRAVSATDGKAKAYKDFRKLLEQKDIDAVVIATPPHWHPLMSIAACEAGKDVYCEKPMCLHPAEGKVMLKAAKDNKRISQIGTQIHAGDNYRRAVEIVQSGVLGKIMNVRIVVTMNEYPGGIGNPADSAPLEGLDWDMWLGPAPVVPFNIARFKDGNHRYFKEYVGSWLNELGPHIIDLAYWAMNPGEPKAVSASGGRFVADDISDIPDTLDILWEYDDFTMNFIHTSGNSFNFGFGGAPDGGRRLGVMFHGTKGTLMATYGEHWVVSEGKRLADFQPPARSIPSSPGHEREFLNSVKSREECTCSFDYHIPLAIAMNLGHAALDSGQKIHWDSKAGRIIGDKKLQQLANPNYRKPWRLPKI